MMSQFMVNPSEDHINKSLHIVHYVNTNLNSKIGYDGKQEEGFIAYADADWASDHISRKSVTGYIIKLAGGAVSWVSRKQKTVALSSTEAEYMCLSDTTRQIVWIESLFKELNFDISNVALCGDNQGAIFLASNPAQEPLAANTRVLKARCLNDEPIYRAHELLPRFLAETVIKAKDGQWWSCLLVIRIAVVCLVCRRLHRLTSRRSIATTSTHSHPAAIPTRLSSTIRRANEGPSL
jgi:hypothetical protein